MNHTYFDNQFQIVFSKNQVFIHTDALYLWHMTNYERVEKAIHYINSNFQFQPELEDVAAHVHLSQFHFQRLFKDWAGVTPKKFLQYISLKRAKELLRSNLTIADASHETGMSGPSRLHDLFITLEGMTPGEYRNEGMDLHINYSFAETPFGDVLIASTGKGICHISFPNDEAGEFEILKQRFSRATYTQKTDMLQQNALQIFKQDWKDLPNIKLHLKGSSFQLKVWEALLKIPFGSVSTYSTIAARLNYPKASRAVGTAVAANPIAFLIPCHRVIRSTGVIGQYHWGSNRKTAMIGWEAGLTEQ